MSTHRRRGGRLASRRGLAAVLAALCVVALAGCTPAGKDDGPRADVSAHLPAQNLARWTMPLDQYMVTAAQSRRESYAIAVLTQECLDQHGFRNQIPSMSIVDDPDDLGIRDAFTPEVVAQFGYHSAGVMRQKDPAWRAYTTRPMSDAESAAQDQCLTGLLDDGFVRYENQVLNFASGLAQSAFAGSLQDPEVKKTAAAWRACMAPKGIEDLADDPSGMPTESLSRRFGLTATPDAGQTVEATPEEITLAVFDAKCRQSSGYERARYEAEWSRQVTLLAENLTALEDVKSRITDIDRSLREVIVSHAPAA